LQTRHYRAIQFQIEAGHHSSQSYHYQRLTPNSTENVGTL